jgi:hypothetical protein
MITEIMDSEFAELVWRIGRLSGVTYISVRIYEYCCMQMTYFSILILGLHNVWANV